MTIIEYPQQAWDAQREARRAALERGRSEMWKAFFVLVTVGALASLLAVNDPQSAPGALVASVLVAAAGSGALRAALKRRAHRVAVRPLRDVMHEAGLDVTENQAGMLLGVGCC